MSAKRAWHARYQRPFWVAETSNLGLAVGDGPRWLHELVGALANQRAKQHRTRETMAT